MGRFLLRAAVAALVVLAWSGQRPVWADYVSAVLGDGPLAYWRLGELGGPTAYDASGLGQHGTYINGVTFGQEGALETDTDKSIWLNGTTGCVDMGVHAALNQLRNDFTIEAWYRGGGSGFLVSTRDACG